MGLRKLIVMLAAILTLLVPSGAGQFGAIVPLPADLQGELNGVRYRIRVPENWNGTLLVYAHGYGDNIIPPMLAPQGADVAPLLAQGYALAASRFEGTGWYVKEGMQDTLALTSAFRDMVGHPLRTIIWGKSLGGLMALGLIEKHAGLFDGAIALCPPAAGSPRRWDLALDLTLSYAVVFGWNDSWGTPGDIRDDLNFMTEVLPTFSQTLTPAQKGKWEFIRSVNRIPSEGFYAKYPPIPMYDYRAITMLFAIGYRAELESRAGGAVAENFGRTYTLSDEDKDYLCDEFDLDADTLDAWLAEMNEKTTFRADRNARNYLEHYVNPSGRINRPVLTLHTTGDPLATPNHETALRDTVAQWGDLNLLIQQFTTGTIDATGFFQNTHCSFCSDQDLAAINAMMHWLETGSRPDASFFPAELGFDPFYIMQPWPW
jgi:pimeloyl-ACP methyl ester carboxylesterase